MLAGSWERAEAVVLEQLDLMLLHVDLCLEEFPAQLTVGFQTTHPTPS